MKVKFLGLLLALVVLAGCGTDDTWVASDVYRPQYMGEYGQCYYLDNPDEVGALVADGLCQGNWTPMLAPVYWQARYAPYYDSPAYYDVYVVPARRDVFKNTRVAWESSNKGLISSERSRAAWIDAKKRPVLGTKIDYSTASFGSGRLRSTGFDAGGLRAPKGFGTGPPPRVKVKTDGSLAGRGLGAGGSKIKSTFSSGSVRSGGSTYKPPPSRR